MAFKNVLFKACKKTGGAGGRHPASRKEEMGIERLWIPQKMR